MKSFTDKRTKITSILIDYYRSDSLYCICLRRSQYHVSSTSHCTSDGRRGTKGNRVVGGNFVSRYTRRTRVVGSGAIFSLRGSLGREPTCGTSRVPPDSTSTDVPDPWTRTSSVYQSRVSGSSRMGVGVGTSD